MGAHPLYSALSRRGRSPIKLAYSPSRPDGRLKLTASAFNRLGQYTCSPGHRGQYDSGTLYWNMIGMRMFLSLCQCVYIKISAVWSVIVMMWRLCQMSTHQPVSAGSTIEAKYTTYTCPTVSVYMKIFAVYTGPAAGPHDVDVISNASSSAHVCWQLPSRSEWNGKLLGCLVSLEPITTSSTGPRIVLNTTDIGGTSSRGCLAIADLRPGAVYEVYIKQRFYVLQP